MSITPQHRQEFLDQLKNDDDFQEEDTTKGSEDDADVIANQMEQMERRHALVRELNQQKF